MSIGFLNQYNQGKLSYLPVHMLQLSQFNDNAVPALSLNLGIDIFHWSRT